jgi:hypothetical protein
MKLKTLEKAVDSLPKNLAKLSWIQKNDYLQLQDRIYYLYLLYYFLSLREKIKKEVQESYVNKSKEQILESIVVYDDYGSIDFEGNSIWQEHLEPLIENYIQQQINKIENNTLKLEL